MRPVSDRYLGYVFGDATVAQKQGGVLRIFDQHVAQNHVAAIVPELATSWSLSEDGTELTLQLREGVKWLTLSVRVSANLSCHISPRDMRTHPINTGPFKFGREFSRFLAVSMFTVEEIRAHLNRIELEQGYEMGRPRFAGLSITVRDRRLAAAAVVSEGVLEA